MVYTCECRISYYRKIWFYTDYIDSTMLWPCRLLTTFGHFLIARRPLFSFLPLIVYYFFPVRAAPFMPSFCPSFLLPFVLFGHVSRFDQWKMGCSPKMSPLYPRRWFNHLHSTKSTFQRLHWSLLTVDLKLIQIGLKIQNFVCIKQKLKAITQICFV